MFEALFIYPKVSARHRTGPSVDAREQYLAHCASYGAARATLLRLANELLVIAERIDVNAGKTISLADVEAAADSWIVPYIYSPEELLWCGASHQRSKRFMTPPLGQNLLLPAVPPSRPWHRCASRMLGHVSLDTTNIYAEIDLEMKAKALAKCEPVADSKPRKRWREQPELMDFLRSL